MISLVPASFSRGPRYLVSVSGGRSPMRTIYVSVLLGAALAVAAPGAAQTVVRRPAARHVRTLAFNAYGVIEIENMLAKNSFQAVTTDKKSSLTFAGAGLDIADVY